MNISVAEFHGDKDCPFFFYDDVPQEAWYKIYNDGSHYVASRIFRSQVKPKAKARSRTDFDILFDSLYLTAMQEGLRDTKSDKAMTAYIKAGILKLFSDYDMLDETIAERIKRKRNNYCHRAKRFRRKAYLNRWNRFVTVTFDDRKHTEESFRKKLRKCLSNLHTRRGWKYMGVFERAPETGRLHFHGLFYVPDGEMIGKVYRREDYSTAQEKMQVTYPNTFFEEAFGRNDFEELDEMELKNGNAIDYLLKYISKTGERIVYSRDIPTEVCMKLPAREIVVSMLDFVRKFVLFDDTVKWERDVMHYKPKQLSMLDLLSRSPQAA